MTKFIEVGEIVQQNGECFWIFFSDYIYDKEYTVCSPWFSHLGEQWRLVKDPYCETINHYGNDAFEKTFRLWTKFCSSEPKRFTVEVSLEADTWESKKEWYKRTQDFSSDYGCMFTFTNINLSTSFSQNKQVKVFVDILRKDNNDTAEVSKEVLLVKDAEISTENKKSNEDVRNNEEKHKSSKKTTQESEICKSNGKKVLPDTCSVNGKSFEDSLIYVEKRVKQAELELAALNAISPEDEESDEDLMSNASNRMILKRKISKLKDRKRFQNITTEDEESYEYSSNEEENKIKSMIQKIISKSDALGKSDQYEENNKDDISCKSENRMNNEEGNKSQKKTSAAESNEEFADLSCDESDRSQVSDLDTISCKSDISCDQLSEESNNQKHIYISKLDERLTEFSCDESENNEDAFSCESEENNEDRMSNEEENMSQKETSVTESNGVVKLLQDLKSLLLSGQNSDVTLKIQDRQFKVHRNILSVRSPVFASMLQQDIKDIPDVLNIPDCSAEAFEMFLTYVYTGKLETTSSGNVFDLYYTADKFQIDDLKLECVHYLKKNLSIENFYDVMTLSFQLTEPSLKEKVAQFFCDNLKAILKTVKWQEYSENNPLQANELYAKALNQCLKYKEICYICKYDLISPVLSE